MDGGLGPQEVIVYPGLALYQATAGYVNPALHKTEINIEAKANGKGVQSVANLASYPIKNLQGQNFTIPVHPVNFSFKPCATSDMVGGNSKQSQA